MEDMKLFIQNEIMSIAFVKVGFDDSLLASRLVDSISMVDLIVSIEDRIGKKIPQHLISDENFDSINTIIATLEKV